MKRRLFYKNHYGHTNSLEFNLRLKEVLKIFATYRFEKVLDIGCGDGFFAKKLQYACQAKEIYGIDISEEAIKESRRRGIIAYRVDVEEESLPFPDDFFDAVYCGEVIEHLYDPDHLLSEVYRVLKRNGVFVLTTPNLGSLYNRLCLLLGYQPFGSEVSLYHDVGHLFRIGTAGHIRCFTLRSLKELTLIHGFKVYKVVGIGINTKIGVGKRLRIPATVINKILQNFPSLASDLLLVLGK
jgi:SAM-dependent methyltransferase